MDGRISIHRKIMEWGWYSDVNTFSAFIHCLLKANIQDKIRQGIEIKRGSFISSIGNLSDEVGITRKQMLLVLERLEKGGELVTKRDNKKTLFIVIKYNDYQSEEGRKVQQRDNKGITKEHQRDTTKEDKNNKNEKNSEFEMFWKIFPHARKGKRKESEIEFIKHDIKNVIAEVNYLNRCIKFGIQDGNYISACERWIRDFTQTSPSLKQQNYKTMVFKFMDMSVEERRKIKDELMEMIGEELFMQYHKERTKQKSGISLNFKK